MTGGPSGRPVVAWDRALTASGGAPSWWSAFARGADGRTDDYRGAAGVARGNVFPTACRAASLPPSARCASAVLSLVAAGPGVSVLIPPCADRATPRTAGRHPAGWGARGWSLRRARRNLVVHPPIPSATDEVLRS